MLYNSCSFVFCSLCVASLLSSKGTKIWDSLTMNRQMNGKGDLNVQPLFLLSTMSAPSTAADNRKNTASKDLDLSCFELLNQYCTRLFILCEKLLEHVTL